MTGRSTTQSAPGHYVTRILDVLARDPRAPRVHTRWGRLDGAAVIGAVRAARAELAAAGAGPGTTVGILTATNHPLTFTARYAAHLLGTTVVYVRSANPGADVLLPAAEQAALLEECGAEVLVVDPAHAARGVELAGVLPRRPAVRVLDIGPYEEHDAEYDTEPAAEHEAAAAGAGPAAEHEAAATGAGPAAGPECAVITYTSGSGGRPKGVRQSFAAWNRLVLDDAAALAAEPREPAARMLVVTPTSHTVAVMADVVLAAGGSLVVHEHFDAGRVLADIGELRITRGYLTVPQLYRLVDHPGAATAELSSLRQLVYSGCTASPARLAEAFRLFGPVLVQCYGSTEAGRITLLDGLDHFETELLPSVGRPFPGVEVRILASGTGRSDHEVEIGEIGEIVVRSAYLMSGYQGDPALTAGTLRDGWLRTGDLGRWDAYGRLHLVDRVGRVVKTAGVKVHPADVERALLTHPAVADCSVYGLPDPVTGEAVHAAVVLRAPSTPSELRAHVAAALSPAHAPDRFVRWPELPLTDSGKPDQRRLRDTAPAAGPGLSTSDESEPTW
ncbi:class I adenylate-forming enzyme family protein [Streptomyces fradiae]|uniref:class I adenylate-forming enzyme family protein n=1 Tax=Streptomyces fradiae TaxID=1906 RepID=UPI0035177702